MKIYCDSTNIKNVDSMKAFGTMIPYCGNCLRKTKKEGLAKDEYYCDVFTGTPMKGVVTPDTAETFSMKHGL